MNKNLLSAVVLAAALTALNAQTVDQIVARNITARGGAKRLAALETQSMTGTLGFAPNPGGPFHVEMKRPGKLRQEISPAFIQVTDGIQGFVLKQGKPPEPMLAGQLTDLAGSADFEGPLFRYEAKGNKVELAGKEKLDGRDAYKLIITMRDGTQRTDFIDAKTYLESKWEGVVGGQKMETWFHDYRKVKGLAYSHSLDTTGPGFQQKLVFTKIEVNVPLSDSHFTKP